MSVSDGGGGRGVLLVGATSDAGADVLAAGICHGLARRGVRVAPFAPADSLAELERLRATYDVVVCAGVGSDPAATELAGLDIAEAADLPVVVVADIDRGGVFAHLYGTLALLDRAAQARVAGFVITHFRGDPTLLEPGLARLHELTGRATLGVVPHVERPDLLADLVDAHLDTAALDRILRFGADPGLPVLAPALCPRVAVP